LTPQVPQLAAEQVAQVLADVLRRAEVQRSELNAWVLHPGGRDVLVALSDRLGLAEADLRWSSAVLEEFGNLSSA